jgi:hypothetical protein
MRNTRRAKIHTNRLEIRLSDQSMATLKSLQERTEAVSFADVMRVALNVYSDVLDGKPVDPWSALN